MNKAVGDFQSYLVVGDKAAVSAKSEEITAKLGMKTNEKSPDILIIHPQKSSIGIDEIRSLKKNIYQKPVKEKVKLVIVDEAEKLTEEAQNSFLKLLEEPPVHAVIILKATNKKSFLPTIISRVTPILVVSAASKAQNIQAFALKDLISHFTESENHGQILKDTIISQVSYLKEQVLTDASFEEITSTIEALEKMHKASLMIEANVNPTHVLIALSISLKSQKFSL